MAGDTRLGLISCTNKLLILPPIPFIFHSLVVGSWARPVEAEGRVGVELAANAVAGGAKGDEKDDANGEQLDGDLLEGTDALGDSVRCIAVSGVRKGWTVVSVGTYRSAPPSVKLLALL